MYTDYRRQLTKFASVQDRLREWVPDVMERLSLFSCLTIQMLDIDGFRYDKATQVTLDAEAEFSSNMRECARAVGKDNFFIPGEITGGNTFGAMYIGESDCLVQLSGSNIDLTPCRSWASTGGLSFQRRGRSEYDECDLGRHYVCA